VHLLAPVVLVVAAFLTYAVLPIGRGMVIANLNAGVLFFFAVGTLVELAVFMAGWSSHSKYSLAAGRDARGGADDQLRDTAGAGFRGGDYGSGVSLAGGNCCGSGQDIPGHCRTGLCLPRGDLRDLFCF